MYISCRDLPDQVDASRGAALRDGAGIEKGGTPAQDGKSLSTFRMNLHLLLFFNQ